MGFVSTESTRVSENQLALEMKTAIKSARRALTIVAISFCIGCENRPLPSALPDYAARTLSVKELFVGQKCELESNVRVASGWVPVHFVFSGDNQILEETTLPSVSVKYLDSNGNVLAEESPEFYFREEDSVYLFACFLKVPQKAKGHFGQIDLFGNSQFLLIRKNFNIH